MEQHHRNAQVSDIVTLAHDGVIQLHEMPDDRVVPDPSWPQYPRTVLCFSEHRFEIDLREPVSTDDAELLAKFFPGPFCVITPDNPHGLRSTDEDNAARRARLLRLLRELDAPHTPCDGRSPNRLHRECGWAVALPIEVARYVARRFEQTAFFSYDTRRFWLEPACADTERCPLPTRQDQLPPCNVAISITY